MTKCNICKEAREEKKEHPWVTDHQALKIAVDHRKKEIHANLDKLDKSEIREVFKKVYKHENKSEAFMRKALHRLADAAPVALVVFAALVGTQILIGCPLNVLGYMVAPGSLAVGVGAGLVANR